MLLIGVCDSCIYLSHLVDKVCCIGVIIEDVQAVQCTFGVCVSEYFGMFCFV